MVFVIVQGPGGLQPHALTFDSGSEIGSAPNSAPGSGAPSPSESRSHTPERAAEVCPV